MDIVATEIPDVKVITPDRWQDDRGFFSELYNRRTLAASGIGIEFVQDNMSLTRTKGTIRGLHFQRPPHAQAKLVRVLKGAIWDVAVDLRRGSPSFGRWVARELSAENFQQLLVPVGFAHGFCTLTDDVEVFYKVDDHYASDCDDGIRWDDPDLAVAWPLADTARGLSDKDRALPLMRDFDSPFHYGG